MQPLSWHESVDADVAVGVDPQALTDAAMREGDRALHRSVHKSALVRFVPTEVHAVGAAGSGKNADALPRTT